MDYLIAPIDKKDILNEGITKEFMDSLNMVSDHSPAQLNVGDEPVSLLECKSGFWIVSEGEILRDTQNKYIVISDREARIGRARYILNNQGLILEHKVQKEVDRLQKIAILKAKDYLKQMKGILEYTDEKDTLYIIMSAIDDGFEQKKEKAIKTITPEFMQQFQKINEMVDSKDYDNMYISFCQEGLPLITSYNMNSKTDINALIKSFHIDMLPQTLDEIKTHSHIYNVAKQNVLKLQQ